MPGWTHIAQVRQLALIGRSGGDDHETGPPRFELLDSVWS